MKKLECCFKTTAIECFVFENKNGMKNRPVSEMSLLSCNLDFRVNIR